MELKELFKDIEKHLEKEVKLEGWIRNHRKQKEFGFIDFYDGTTFQSIQIVYESKLSNFDEISKLRVGCSIEVRGTLAKSQGNGQDYEILASDVILLGDCPEDYPIQPKRHTREFLREVGYLRPRTNLFQAVFRIRSLAAYAIHTYFQENGYVYFHSPIITASDCEGAGEMFQVTTLDLDKIAKTGKVDYSKDFFGKPANLTVSGQLQGEAYALAFRKIYTFGPTFRAENSNTKTHASEFWMIEPEIAFCDLNQDMDIMEDMLKFIIKYVLEKAPLEMQFLDKFVENGLINKLEHVLNSKAVRITHHEAIEVLINSGKKFENEPKFGEDLATEHEKYLTSYYNSPVFVKDWPKEIKAFYMRLNDDNKTVGAVDLLVPQAGELMGGSQREERLDVLVNKMNELGVPTDGMDWYLNLRKYGGCVHSGFGMGFERLLIYLTGVENIRDVIPFPRTPGNCEF
ncbi:MAG: asparagine--tRNA ligase [Candidatus Faecisoma sp.]|nr:asparagine--tRNA ligase [Acholeplasma sp.]MDY2892700.1 asparagine--tRNA ligase [Candidatus Faecisoma sp.]